MNNEDNVIRASGLNRNSNDIVLPPGSLVAADECAINKDNVISRRRGFLKCATGLPLNKPEQLFTDGNKLYVHINNQVYYALNGTCDYLILQGQTPTFNAPLGLFNSANNILYITSFGDTLRDIDLLFSVSSTLAGTANTPGSADGAGAAARFRNPDGVWGNTTDLYICDVDNQTIRRYNIATNTVSTFAGTAGAIGSADGIGAAARFNNPRDIWGNATDLYVCDNNNQTIRRIDIATATVTTFVGTAGASGSADGIGAAARFNFPIGIWGNATDLYVCDANNSTIRKIDIATATVSTFAGTALAGGYVNDTGAAARFNVPIKIWGNATHLYVTDSQNRVVRKIVIATAAVTTLAGAPPPSSPLGTTDGFGSAASFDFLWGISGDSSYVYVSDRNAMDIRRIDLASTIVTTFAGIPYINGNFDGFLLNSIQGP